MKNNSSFILNHTPLWRTIISLGIAVAVFFPLYLSNQPLLLAAVFAWIAFSATYLILSWIIISRRPVEEIKKKANQDDGSVVFVFFIIIISAIASMVAVLILTTSQDTEVKNNVLMIPAAVTSMILAWILVNTQYVFHYAHEYYDEDDPEENNQKGGLKFPEDEEPNYMDFAYFSFCMGCTYQVSDVSVTSKLIRKIVMIHGLLAFFINTFVVALTINMVAGLNQ